MTASATKVLPATSSSFDTLYEELCAYIDREGFIPSKSKEPQKKEAFWQIGKAIDAACSHDERGDRAEIKRLGTRLNAKYKRGFGGNVLTEALRTYRAFPDHTSLDHPLTWKHYVTLSRVNDEKLRQTLLGKAIQRGWDARTLSMYAEGDLYSPWSDLYGTYYWKGFCDPLVKQYAIAYAGSCGVIPVATLHDIYLQEVENPVDSFDFNETMQFLRAQRRDADLPDVRKQGDQLYLVDRSLANELGEQDDWHRGYGEAADDQYRHSSIYDPDDAWLKETRQLITARRKKDAQKAIQHLARRNGAHAVKRLSQETITAEQTPSMELSILGMRAFQRLIAQLCNPRPSEINPRTGLYETNEELQYAALRLCRQVMQHGLPTREEMVEDVCYLIALSGAIEPTEAIMKLVLQTLAELYRDLPLWTLGGYSQADLERGLISAEDDDGDLAQSPGDATDSLDMI